MFRLFLVLNALLCWVSLASAAQSITLEWTQDPAVIVTGYQIQRCVGSIECTPVDLPGATTTGAKVYTDRTVVFGQPHCYAVVALKGTERASPSTVACGANYTDPAEDPATYRSLVLKFAVPTPTTPAP